MGNEMNVLNSGIDASDDCVSNGPTHFDTDSQSEENSTVREHGDEGKCCAAGTRLEGNADRRFSQKDLDYIIGKKTGELTRKHSALLDNLSVMLGVPREQVSTAVRERSRKQADTVSAGSEKASDAFCSDAAVVSTTDEESAERIEQAIRGQLAVFSGKMPGFDIDSAISNKRFADALRLFCMNDSTRDNALELAYNAVFFDDAVKKIARIERERIIGSMKVGTMRVSEGAMLGGGHTAAKLDVSSMNDRQIAALAARVMRGEKIKI